MWRNNSYFDVDTRIQVNPDMVRLWREKMQESRYVHSQDTTYEMIGFTPQP